jgi:putative ABC transport system ATP-binding protein
MNRENSIIKVQDICKDFYNGRQTIEVLKNINLSFLKGDFVSIMGQSGCGKSTLLYILGGMDTPTKGRVLLNGKNIADMTDKQKGVMRRRKVGFIFQFYNLVQNLSVRDNILIPIIMDGKNVFDYEGKLNEVLEFVGLSDRKNFTPRELSGGQQQRVAIARTLIIEPEIILADEPIGNLDSNSGTQVMELFRKINRKRGTTIIQVTHSKSAAEYGTKIITMKDGAIIN